MKITFLGTSSGKTSQNRFHSSLLISLKNYNLLIDTGDGISRALISNQININSIKGILLTHLHADHFSGLPALITQMKIAKRKEKLEIFLHKSLLRVVKIFLLNSYLLPERMGFNIVYKTFKENEKIGIAKTFFMTAKKNSHFKELEKYKSHKYKLSLVSTSFLFEFGKKKLIYSSDIGSAEDILLFDVINPDILITEVTHISINSLLKKIKILNPFKTYLTHYSDEYIPLLSEILSNPESSLMGKVILAEDNISFNF